MDGIELGESSADSDAMEAKMSMSTEKTMLVVIRHDSEATVHKCEIDLDISSEKLTDVILNSLQLSGKYDLYVKLQPNVNLSSLDIDAESLIVMSRDVRTKSNMLFK